MDGMGIVKGMGVTLRRFLGTFVDDLKWLGKRYYTEEGVARRSSTATRGIFTVQYPEEKLSVAEEFRYVPFLVYDIQGVSAQKAIRCTACGICSKVCPPQCIWIVRDQDEKGKPLTRPAAFYIDIDVCMNCGFCAEFCPFDSIVMDHDYKLADYERLEGHIYDLQKLLRPAGYYANIRPAQYAARQGTKKKDSKTKEE